MVCYGFGKVQSLGFEKIFVFGGSAFFEVDVCALKSGIHEPWSIRLVIVDGSEARAV